jgi:hypothetical protein
MGNPKDESTFIGPMISEREATRLDGWIQQAVASGGFPAWLLGQSIRETRGAHRTVELAGLFEVALARVGLATATREFGAFDRDDRGHQTCTGAFDEFGRFVE